ncbi:hypothetical protein [Kaarinaea lacus]
MRNVRINKHHYFMVLILFLIAMLFSTRSYGILLSAVADSDNVVVGDNINIEIVVSGLEDPTPAQNVGAYHLELTYSSDILVRD